MEDKIRDEYREDQRNVNYDIKLNNIFHWEIY